MIALHRLCHRAEPFLLNPDLIEKVEAHPDTVVTLTTGARFLVDESPAEVTAAIRAWRAGILSDALHRSEAFARPADDGVDRP